MKTAVGDVLPSPATFNNTKLLHAHRMVMSCACGALNVATCWRVPNDPVTSKSSTAGGGPHTTLGYHTPELLSRPAGINEEAR